MNCALFEDEDDIVDWSSTDKFVLVDRGIFGLACVCGLFMARMGVVVVVVDDGEFTSGEKNKLFALDGGGLSGCCFVLANSGD